MNTLREAVRDYLEMRRSRGFKLRETGKRLPAFVKFLEEHGASFITTRLALVWAQQPSTVQPAEWAHRLSASQQAGVCIRERKRGEQGEGFPATRAKAASDANPNVMFIVRLLAPTTVADDGIAFTNRASPQHDLVAVSSPVGFELMGRSRKWDKKNRGS